MSRSAEKRPQDEHVKRPLEEPGPLLCLFRHRRQSTLNLAAMVDIRLSLVKGRIRVWILNFRAQPVISRCPYMNRGDATDRQIRSKCWKLLLDSGDWFALPSGMQYCEHRERSVVTTR
jgi:hypothetical protein